MDKARKKKLKRIIAAVCAVAVVILLAAMPLIAGGSADSDGPKASTCPVPFRPAASTPN